MNKHLKELKDLERQEEQQRQMNILTSHSMYLHLMEACRKLPMEQATQYRQTADQWLNTLTPDDKLFIFDSTH